MFKWISNLFLGGIGETADKVSKAVSRFTGDKVQTEKNIHTEAQAVYEGYKSEFASDRPGRTWWDSLVDGLNRLPRPALAFGVIGLLAWAPGGLGRRSLATAELVLLWYGSAEDCFLILYSQFTFFHTSTRPYLHTSTHNKSSRLVVTSPSRLSLHPSPSR